LQPLPLVPFFNAAKRGENRLRLRLTNGKPALARWMGEVEAKIGKM
jgi:hypothetical protein